MYDLIGDIHGENVPCLDYSVALLVAYRWDGQEKLKDSSFVSVARGN